ncbi:hypothetical protein PACTADRAFT_1674 [Pachysolen tannophilus NRRL Y-2460]|uniref:Uncharacterized protein n=1 Tax=Pachysolen tannophilus NRRL Y-2460 TaxID=669874 RepID=A0A1E4TZB4_PACTA|nr:hypothetical protein PACTADRAFT_1674 [Pachysolen tannophilus NRRL Y-2460]
MSDPIDRVFDSVYMVYSTSAGLISNSVEIIKSKSLEINEGIIGNANKMLEKLPNGYGYAFGKNGSGVVDVPPPSTYETCCNWVSKNKKLLILSLTGSLLLCSYILKEIHENEENKKIRKRRANKLPNGARYETILIIGSPLNHSIQKLIRDLNQRSFIIYITVSNEQELKIIEMEDSIDIRSLLISYESNKTIKDSLNKFKQILLTPIKPFQHSISHYLNLKSILIIPDYTHFPKGLINEIPINEWQRIINSHFLNQIGLINCGLFDIIRENNLRKEKIEKINGLYLNDDEIIENNGKNQIIDIGGDTKLIFINFIKNQISNNCNFPESLSILLKNQLYDTIYKDIQYYNNLNINKSHQSKTFLETLKSYFIKEPRSINFVNISRLTVKYSPSLNTKDSMLLDSSSMDRFYDTNFSISKLFITWKQFWQTKFFNTTTASKRLSSTKLHHQIFDMIYSKDILKKNYYID